MSNIELDQSRLKIITHEGGICIYTKWAAGMYKVETSKPSKVLKVLNCFKITLFN